MVEQQPAKVAQYDAQPLWKKHLGKILVVSLILNGFLLIGADSVVKGRLLLFAIAAIAIYVGGEVVKYVMSPNKLLSVGEAHILPAAQRFFVIPVTMADCVDMRPLSTREWLYEFVTPGDGSVWTFGWDRVRREVSRKEPYPIYYLQKKFSEDKLTSALLSGQIVRDRAQELAESQGMFVPGLGEDE